MKALIAPGTRILQLSPDWLGSQLLWLGYQVHTLISQACYALLNNFHVCVCVCVCVCSCKRTYVRPQWKLSTTHTLVTTNNETRFNSQEWYTRSSIRTGVKFCGAGNLLFVKCHYLNAQPKNQDIVIHVSHLIQLKYSSNWHRSIGTESSCRLIDTSQCSGFSLLYLRWLHYLRYNQN